MTNLRPDDSLIPRELENIVSSAKAREPLSRHSTFAIGGPADFYVEVKTRDQLKNLWNWTKKNNLPLVPIGQGSNLLIGDKGLRGVVARLRGEFEEIRFEDEYVRAGAGVFLPLLARQCAERGLAGTEAAAGIPGTLGGGLMTNAGTPEGDLSGVVEEVEVLDKDGEFRRRLKKEIRFSYRHSDLQGQFIVGARLKLRRENKNDILRRIEFQLKRRSEKQPLGTFNCGSVFKNPPGDFAGRLIEAAGLKGLREGGARVSPKHGNFIENFDRATALDVRRLIEKIRRTVEEKFGVRLELEVWTVGEE